MSLSNFAIMGFVFALLPLVVLLPPIAILWWKFGKRSDLRLVPMVVFVALITQLAYDSARLFLASMIRFPPW